MNHLVGKLTEAAPDFQNLTSNTGHCGRPNGQQLGMRFCEKGASQKLHKAGKWIPILESTIHAPLLKYKTTSVELEFQFIGHIGYILSSLWPHGISEDSIGQHKSEAFLLCPKFFWVAPGV